MVFATLAVGFILGGPTVGMANARQARQEVARISCQHDALQIAETGEWVDVDRECNSDVIEDPVVELPVDDCADERLYTSAEETTFSGDGRETTSALLVDACGEGPAGGVEVWQNPAPPPFPAPVIAPPGWPAAPPNVPFPPLPGGMPRWTPTTNYCGAGSPPPIDIDRGPGFNSGMYDFSVACYNHDACYTSNVPRATCDVRFAQDLVQSCWDVWPSGWGNWWYRSQCLNAVNNYYAVVVGCTALDAGRQATGLPALCRANQVP